MKGTTWLDLIFIFTASTLTGCFSQSDITTIPAGAAGTTVQSGNGQLCDPANPDFQEGDGSVANPYQISSLCHLSALASSKFENSNFILVADVDMTSFPAYSGFVLNGTLDGQFHKLSNWTGSTPLFDDIEGTVQNLKIVNFSISDASRVAPLANYVGTNGKVINVSSTNGSVTSNNSFAGGLVGVNDGLIQHCQSSTSVLAGEGGAGGLVGVNHGTIQTSFATGTVVGDTSKSDGNQVGGLVGYNLGTVTNSAAGGTVRGMSQVGGLVGQNAGTINNCLSVGLVAGSVASFGGLVGDNTSGTVNASYWDTITSNQATSAGGTGLTTSQMQTQSSYSGWDFTTVWIAPVGGQYPQLR